MNVYDFDQTIFEPDSSYAFVLYCLRHYPRIVLRAFPGTALEWLRRFMKLSDTTALKQRVFSFLNGLDDVDRIVDEFWEKHWDGIGDWYLAQQREDDLVISASPEFLLRPVADRLGFSLIATRMDRKTGEILGKNCHDEEKLTRYLAKYGDAPVDAFYSDSLSDSPMARVAKEAFLIRHGQKFPWPKRK